MNRINIFSPTLRPCESYSVIANQLHSHLSEMGMTVGMTGWGDEMAGAIDNPDFTIYLGAWPEMYAAFPSAEGPKIAVSMWESTILPHGWCDSLNQMDSVIVPSRFCHNVFLDCGVTVPLHTVALGVDTLYRPTRRPQSTPMRFLAFLDRGRRKGGHVALAAFQKAFGDNPDYQLVLKVRENTDRVDLLKVGNIELVQQDMTEQELYELYCSCDVMIAANACEGFGMLPRDFAQTGGISLATDFGGTADDIEQWGWPLPYELTKSDWTGWKDYEQQDLGQWAAFCSDDVAMVLRHVAEHRDIFTHLAYENAGNVHRLYSWRRFSEQVYAIGQGVA
jgi:glycosyltransferase involved in cell wall biosynthesis